MLHTKIIDKSLSDLKEVKKLYLSAFPHLERMPFWLLLLSARKSDKIKFLALYDDDKFCGFCYLFIHKNVVFILYLAICAKLRGKGYGGAALNMISAKFPNHVLILDIEKVGKHAKNFDERLSRKEFYLKSGFISSGLKIKDGGVKYEILIKGGKISKKMLKKIYKKLGKI